MSNMNGTSMQAMPMPNAIPITHPHLLNPNVKDSRWLTLEVCREFTRNKCTRSDQECKFAHPPPHVEVQNGRVTCCFDSIKGKCQRKDPPCKYLHPPQHLKEQLLQNGRNNLILRNLQMQAIAGGLQPVISGVVPTVMYEPTSSNKGLSPLSYSTVLQGTYPFATHPYVAAPNAAQAFNPYLPGLQTGVMPMEPSNVSVPVSVSTGSQQIPGMVGATTPSGLTQKVARADRLESSTAVSASSGGISSWNGHHSATHGSPSETMVSNNSSPYNHPVYFQGISPGVGMVPIVKRTAVDGKGGVPVYPATGNTAAYQQALAAMQLQQQYVPVTIAGHPPSMPRF